MYYLRVVKFTQRYHKCFNMKDKNKSARLETIRNGLKEVGGVTALARHLNVSRRWIYDVLEGAGTSERVLSAAEKIIAQGRKHQHLAK